MNELNWKVVVKQSYFLSKYLFSFEIILSGIYRCNMYEVAHTQEACDLRSVLKS